MNRSLLPANSTELENAWSRLGLGEIETLAGLPAGVQITLPPGFAPELAAQYFLAQFAEYFDTPEQLLEAGMPWLRERGTAAGVERALGWIALAGTVEEDGALLHLDPGTPRAPARLDDITKLLLASIPAHVRFYRLFNGYDIRHARLDRSRWDACLLDDDSGLLVDGLKLSFGERHAAELPAPHREVYASRTSQRVTQLRRDTMYWDSWVLDSSWEMDLFGGIGSLRSSEAPERDLGQPELLPGQLHQGSVERDLPDPIAASTSARSAITPERHPRRKWHGPWQGPWRLPIDSKHTSEA